MASCLGKQWTDPSPVTASAIALWFHCCGGNNSCSSVDYVMRKRPRKPSPSTSAIYLAEHASIDLLRNYFLELLAISAGLATAKSPLPTYFTAKTQFPSERTETP